MSTAHASRPARGETAVNATLKRQIGLFQATVLVVGLVIGSGVFFKPRAVFAAAQTWNRQLRIWWPHSSMPCAGYAPTHGNCAASIPA